MGAVSADGTFSRLLLQWQWREREGTPGWVWFAWCANFRKPRPLLLRLGASERDTSRCGWETSGMIQVCNDTAGLSACDVSRVSHGQCKANRSQMKRKGKSRSHRTRTERDQFASSPVLTGLHSPAGSIPSLLKPQGSLEDRQGLSSQSFTWSSGSGEEAPGASLPFSRTILF